jgi:transketolase
MVEQALIAAEILAGRRIQSRVLDCHTIKPLDVDEIVRAAAETGGIVTVEDHNIEGGLGGAVCEIVAEHAPTRVRRVGVRDRFASSGRDYRQLMAYYGLDHTEIVRRAMELLTVDS